ncbi:LysM peptidoglycan-binding domain-containing protein [Halobacillus shinanisalinarum]|uniref:LysM peptidoglycan-binding domain-containing protein n=1 Tax=Halobacillus shinanisalinarum TaxID=2932258 RepID=A0ABY4H1H7_9BACI|nr:3D domain-containing protein [Halobacillus shinanisalinarum]UOQ93497.1 LysM peptidoglycan-binding domain-containing protein [Halobacillus shinanisalinarum]
MKKTVFSLAATAALTGAFATSVSAEEYTVNKGDTLWGISNNNNVTVDQLKAWNNLNSNLIYPKQKLTVTGETSTETSTTYTVKSGDTLSGISKQHNISVDQLMAWNNLSSTVIHPGDEFALKAGAASAPVPEKAEKEEAPAPAPEPKKEEAPEPEPKKEEAPAPEPVSAEQDQSSEQSTSNDVAKEITAEATAYTANCTGCSGVTATGIDLNANPNQKVIAVDPDVIPLGSKVYVEGYGVAIAGDTGGAIDGNRVDLYMPNRQDALDFGRQSVTVQVLSE